MGKAVGGRPDTGILFLGGIKLTLHNRNTFSVEHSVFVIAEGKFPIKGKTFFYKGEYIEGNSPSGQLGGLLGAMTVGKGELIPPL